MSTETFNHPLGTRTAGFIYIVCYREREHPQRRIHPAIAFLREVEASRACTELAEKIQPVPLDWFYQQLPILKFKEHLC